METKKATKPKENTGLETKKQRNLRKTKVWKQKKQRNLRKTNRFLVAFDAHPAPCPPPLKKKTKKNENQ